MGYNPTSEDGSGSPESGRRRHASPLRIGLVKGERLKLRSTREPDQNYPATPSRWQSKLCSGISARRGNRLAKAGSSGQKSREMNATSFCATARHSVLVWLCFGTGLLAGDATAEPRVGNEPWLKDRPGVVPGPEVRLHDALGRLQPVGLHRVVAAGRGGQVGAAGRSAGLDRARQGHRSLQARLLAPAQDLQPAVKFDPAQVGRGRQGRRHEVRRLHHQAPRRLLHVRHAS